MEWPTRQIVATWYAGKYGDPLCGDYDSLWELMYDRMPDCFNIGCALECIEIISMSGALESELC